MTDKQITVTTFVVVCALYVLAVFSVLVYFSKTNNMPERYEYEAEAWQVEAPELIK